MDVDVGGGGKGGGNTGGIGFKIDRFEFDVSLKPKSARCISLILFRIVSFIFVSLIKFSLFVPAGLLLVLKLFGTK
jgi:hypothetical protein